MRKKLRVTTCVTIRAYPETKVGTGEANRLQLRIKFRSFGREALEAKIGSKGLVDPAKLWVKRVNQ